MAYTVIRHADKSGVGFSNSNPKTASLGRTIKFFKALEDGAVYFNTRDGGKQYVVNVSTSLKSQPEIEKAIRDNLASRNSTRDLIVPSSEITKAAQQLLSFLKHSDESSDDEVIIDEGVEIIEAPYPEHGKAQIPRRCFIYDDEDGYPEGYQGFIEHHGILGMKWGVRRYQNADGSLTDAGRKHYGRNYTIRELKKNIQDPNLSYSEKKALVSANKVNRMTKTRYRNAATSVATATTGLAGAGTLAGLMAAGVLSVNPLLPVAALAGGVVSGKVINAGREFLNGFRDLRVEMIDRGLDKQKSDDKTLKVQYDPSTTPEQAKELDKLYSQHTGRQIESSIRKPSDKGAYVVAKPGELPESTRVTGKEEEEFWKAYAKQVAPKETSSSDRPAASPRHMSNIPNNPKDPGTFEQRRSAYISEHKSELLKNAKDKGTFDMEFLESNGDTDKYGKPLEGKELMAAYEKYLDDEIKRGR